MKSIATLTVLSTLLTTVSFAGMVADNLDAPPVTQPTIQIDKTKKPVPSPPKKITVKESLPTENVAETNITQAVKETKIAGTPQKQKVVKPIKKNQKSVSARSSEKTKPTVTKTKEILDTDTKDQSPATALNKIVQEQEQNDIKAEKLPPPSKSGHNDKNSAFFAAIGKGNGSVQSATLGFEFYSEKRWFEEGKWYLTPFSELLLSAWKGDPGHTGIESLHEAGFTVYGRLIREKFEKLNIRPYLDAGLGLHYLTENEIESKELGRQWLAGSNIGIGLVFGESPRFDVGARFRHLSNGGTKDVNWGINFIMLRLAIRF